MTSKRFSPTKRESRTKRNELIDRLLASQEYVEHWTNKWADLLQVNRKYLGTEGSQTVPRLDSQIRR